MSFAVPHRKRREGKGAVSMSNEEESKPRGNIHAGHRERMRRRFFETGLDSFEDHEVLEMLLFYTNAQKNTNEIAHRLLDRFGSIAAVLEADPAEMTAVEGVGEVSASLLAMIPHLARRYLHSDAAESGGALDSNKKVTDYFKHAFVGIRLEQVRIACLDDRLQVLRERVIAEGTPDCVPANVRKIVETAYQCNSTLVILAHNHPRGLCSASKEDIAVTTQLLDVLRGVGIQLLDSVIVADNHAISLFECGYINTFNRIGG